MAPPTCATATPWSWRRRVQPTRVKELISFPSPWTIANIPTPRGRIPGGFFKREGRPTEKEILTSRLIDRPVRPLFAEGFRDETQVIAMVLSADTENNPDVIGLVAGTAALYLSDIPFLAPVGAVRVGLVDGRLDHEPHLQRDQEQCAEPGGGGHGRRHRDGGGGRQGSFRSDASLKRFSTRTAKSAGLWRRKRNSSNCWA